MYGINRPCTIQGVLQDSYLRFRVAAAIVSAVVFVFDGKALEARFQCLGGHGEKCK